ncbi:MAG: hypothetical protein M3Z43_00180 [Bifidobacterium sp.]|nr:hypothetical protein [Bifidobacterium sp.]
MCENIDDLFVQALKENVLPAIGCAEPVAVAYAAAIARLLLDGLLSMLLKRRGAGVAEHYEECPGGYRSGNR